MHEEDSMTMTQANERIKVECKRMEAHTEREIIEQHRRAERRVSRSGEVYILRKLRGEAGTYEMRA
jgi:hypothetical protein